MQVKLESESFRRDIDLNFLVLETCLHEAKKSYTYVILAVANL